MNVVDSSGWVEFFAEGPNGRAFQAVIQDTNHLVVPTICIYEVFKWLAHQLDEEAAIQAAGVMSAGLEIDLNRAIAMNAAQISAELKLAMADSIILATARAYQATLWTQDAHFKGLPDVRYLEKQP
jgi:predicted nucleic acid-binding protein